MAEGQLRIRKIFRMIYVQQKRHGATSLHYVTETVKHMPSLSEAEVHLFWERCLCQLRYHSLLLAAVRYNRIKQLLDLKELDLSHSFRRQFVSSVLLYLITESRWSCLKMFLERYSSSEHLTAELLNLMSNKYLDDAGLDVFKRVLDRCSEFHVPVVKKTVQMVMTRGFSHSFRMLVYSCSKHVRQGVVDGCFGDRNELAYLVVECLNHRVHGSHPDRVTDFEGCLSIACEAGLFSLSFLLKPPPLRTCLRNNVLEGAVDAQQHDLVQFLYTAGAPTYHELFQLNLKLLASTTSVDDLNDSARITREFISDKASEPRSLQSLCVLKVSCQLGWGCVRQANLDQLEISHVLKDALNFRGIGNMMKKKE